MRPCSVPTRMGSNMLKILSKSGMMASFMTLVISAGGALASDDYDCYAAEDESGFWISGKTYREEGVEKVSGSLQVSIRGEVIRTIVPEDPLQFAFKDGELEILLDGAAWWLKVRYPGYHYDGPLACD